MSSICETSVVRSLKSMKSFLTVAALAATILAAPAAEMEPRQLGGCSSTCNELTRGSCAKVIFIMARASTEPGNSE